MSFFLLSSILYVGFFLWCRFHWLRIGSVRSSESNRLVKFTVLIPVRNEADNIKRLLDDLASQNYSKDSFEVLVIDDDSSDDTVNITLEVIKQLKIDCRLIQLSDFELTGKKQALTIGVDHASYDYILATDGDCSLGVNWLASYANQFYESGVHFVSGPVKMQSSSFFESLQAVEFSGLIGIGAATLRSGNPTMCNGANLGYKKTSFGEVRGYEGNEHIASGDDEFLLQKIYKKYPDGVRFLKNPEALVTTLSKPNLSSFLNQRIRWSSKWKHHKSAFILLGAILIFLNCLMVYSAIFLSINNTEWLMLTTVTVGLRWVSVSSFLVLTAKFSNVRVNPVSTLCLELIYPALVIFLGIASIFGHYSWKGRSY